VSELGLGLAALGRPAYINLGHGEDVADATVDGMERAAHAVLDAAYAAGVRRFDAARSYGLAERFLASWLGARGLGRDDVFVSSKWGYAYTGGWRIDAEAHEVKELSGAQLRRQWAETQELLGPWLRLYQIHSATVESGVLDDPGALRCGEQQAVVRPDEEPAVRVLERERTPRPADTGVDDGEVHPDGHVREGAREDERSLEDRRRRDAVGDVDHA